MMIVVGLESTTDVWVTFPSLTSFKWFANEYDGPLARHVKDAYSSLHEGIGGEVPIDGMVNEARRLIKAASDRGAEVKRALGGNGAQEAAALRALGSQVAFAGGIFPHQLTELPLGQRKFFEGIDISFVHTSGEYRPISVILQAHGTNRYILCEGQGRRIEQLRSYLRKLPRSLKQILDKYGGLDMVNLVGWHVLFANGISNRDFRLVEGMIRKIRDAVDSPLFTDAGGLAAFDERGRCLLCQIYSLFDILSMNEDEALQVSRTIGTKAKDEFQAMHNILKLLEKPSTIWLHSLDYQSSLSTKYGKKLLWKAQRAAALAGVCRVERGTYPTPGELAKRKEIKNYSRRGLEAVHRAVKKYGGKMGDARLVITPCYEARSFTSTVGAGDVAAAAYTYTIAGGEI